MLLNLIFKGRRRRMPLCLMLIFMIYCVIVFLVANFVLSRLDVTQHKVTRRIIENTLKQSMENDKGAGCLMPKLDAFAPEIMVFERAVPAIDCKIQNWVICKGNQCTVDPEIMTTHSGVYCSYADIIYIADEDVELGSPLVLRGDEVYHLDMSDFVKVSCGGSDAIYGTWSNWTGHVAGLRPLRRHNVSKGSSQPERYSMLVFAFDSAARHGFERKMPRSYMALTEDLGAVLLNGYNIVGDGTAHAVIPMLTGYSRRELPEVRQKVLFRDLYFVDDFPLIWYLLKSNGYKTGYLEDSPEIGSFTNQYTGFIKQPTDLYGHALVLQSSLDDDPEYCISGIPSHKVFMDLTEQFMQDNSSHRFIFTFSGLAHDDHNMLRAADDDFASWLLRMKNQSLLQDTVLFVMGDHGPRYGHNRNTVQGRLEERLPLMAVVLPESLKRAHPEIALNLAHNAHVLTTPYDLHATFLHIAGLREHSVDISVPGATLRRSLSLLEKIPANRSCTEAGVKQSWCACLRWQPMSNESAISYRLADVLVEFINQLTELERDSCAVRKLARIERVQELRPAADLTMSTKKDRFNYLKKEFSQTLNSHYQVKVTLEPGVGVFEATLMQDWKTHSISTNADSISRISPYGDEPKCIRGRRPDLEKYCYCH